MSGTVNFCYSDSLVFIPTYSLIGSGTHNASLRKINIPFSNLAPGRKQDYIINLRTPTFVPLGTVHSMTAEVLPVANDVTPANNSTSATRIVRAGYDPNDKQVSPGLSSPGYIAGDQVLNYRIRFQNTGTDTAFNIYVLDTISSNLNLETFQMLDASHSMQVQIDEHRVIRWQFDNIRLPDSNTNEPLSHGYINFSIQPNSGLADGIVIPNFADIYFDYNPPVRTNTTISTILDRDSAKFQVINPWVQGANAPLGFEDLYPSVDIWTKNVGIGNSVHAVQLFIQLDQQTPRPVAFASRVIQAGDMFKFELSNFNIRNYYPGVAMTQAFMNSPHQLCVFAKELGMSNSTDSAILAVGVSLPLGTQLHVFDAEAQDNTIQLNWSADVEEMDDRFVVQKYNPQSEIYEDIGQQPVAARFSYNMIDAKPLFGKNEYRLLLQDPTGNRYVLSPGIEQFFGNETSSVELISMAPQPVTNRLQLMLFASQTGPADMEIFDFTGKRVFKQTLPLSEGTHHYDVDLSRLASGHYLIKLSYMEEEISKKLFKR